MSHRETTGPSSTSPHEQSVQAHERKELFQLTMRSYVISQNLKILKELKLKLKIKNIFLNFFQTVTSAKRGSIFDAMKNEPFNDVKELG